jgi:hypothetical protein
MRHTEPCDSPEHYRVIPRVPYGCLKYVCLNDDVESQFGRSIFESPSQFALTVPFHRSAQFIRKYRPAHPFSHTA